MLKDGMGDDAANHGVLQRWIDRWAPPIALPALDAFSRSPGDSVEAPISMLWTSMPRLARPLTASK